MQMASSKQWRRHCTCAAQTLRKHCIDYQRAHPGLQKWPSDTGSEMWNVSLMCHWAEGSGSKARPGPKARLGPKARFRKILRNLKGFLILKLCSSTSPSALRQAPSARRGRLRRGAGAFGAAGTRRAPLPFGTAAGAFGAAAPKTPFDLTSPLSLGSLLWIRMVHATRWPVRGISMLGAPRAWAAPEATLSGSVKSCALVGLREKQSSAHLQFVEKNGGCRALRKGQGAVACSVRSELP